MPCGGSTVSESCKQPCCCYSIKESITQSEIVSGFLSRYVEFFKVNQVISTIKVKNKSEFVGMSFSATACKVSDSSFALYIPPLQHRVSLVSGRTTPSYSKDDASWRTSRSRTQFQFPQFCSQCNVSIVAFNGDVFSRLWLQWRLTSLRQPILPPYILPHFLPVKNPRSNNSYTSPHVQAPAVPYEA